MRIEVKGRNLPVSDDLREHVIKRFRKVSRQVSELAELEVEVFEERNPAISDSQVAEATLHLLDAERIAPQVVRHNVIAQEIVREMLARGSRRQTMALNLLAQRAGLLE